jgi:hypothetical protein
VVTIIVININVLDSSYSMLLGCLWLNDAKVSHDWGTNIVTIRGINKIKSCLLLRNLAFKPKDQKNKSLSLL